MDDPQRETLDTSRVEATGDAGATRVWIVVAVLVVALGAALRLGWHLEGLPFRVDELRLVANLGERSYGGLLQPLGHGQNAPAGFLWIEKAVLDTIGEPHELALRTPALIASLAALPLVLVAGRRLGMAHGGLVATFLVAISPALVLRASDVKQYASDALVTLVLLVLALPIVEAWRRDPGGGAGRRQLLLLAAAGAAALLLSHPAAFTVAGTGLVLAALAVRRRQWNRLAALLPLGVLWLVIFVMLDVVTARHAHSRETLLLWFGGDFMPLPPRSAADLVWLAGIPGRLAHALHLPQVGLAVLLGLLGVRRFVPRHGDRLALVVAPVILALLASGFEVYPFEGRLLTFAAPLVCLLLGAGWQSLVEALHRHRRLIGALLLLVTVRGMVAHLASLPRWAGGRYDVPAALAAAAPEVHPDDLMLVSGVLRYPFDHYAPRAGIGQPAQVIELPTAPGAPILNLDGVPLAGRRAWVVMPHRQPALRAGRGARGDPRPATLALLDARGTRLATRSGVNVSAVLYRFAR